MRGLYNESTVLEGREQRWNAIECLVASFERLGQALFAARSTPACFYPVGYHSPFIVYISWN